MKQSSEYCCEKMGLCINDPTNPFYYVPVLRLYYTKTYRKHIVITMAYCPWCGTQLPKELRSEFFDTLESEYNIETDIGEYKTDPSIPSEFRSDKWWKKRGL